MATFRIIVQVDSSRTTRGTRRVKRELNELEKQAGRLNRVLVGTFAGISTVAAVRGIVNLLDTYNQLENRLRVVTTGQGNLNAVFDELFAVSQRSRSSLQGTVELYSRLAISSRELGVSQQDLIKFTESVNKAIIVSGASFREANQGIIQLSQGIASGTLRGDELRSVLEQLPTVADVIAKELGVTRGELRKLGEEGKITASDIITAFQNAEEDIDEAFAKTIPTISQAFGLLADNLRFTIGRLDNAAGVSELLVRALLFLNDNLEAILNILLALIPALAIRFVGGLLAAAKGAGLLARGMAILNVVLSANPFIAIATALAFVIGLLIQFGDRINVFGSDFITLQDTVIATINVVLGAIQELAALGIAAFNLLFGKVTELLNGFGVEWGDVLGAAGTFLKLWVNGSIGFFVFFVENVIDLFNLLPGALADAGRAAANGLVSVLEAALNFLIQKVREFFNFINAGANLVGLDNILPEISSADLSSLKFEYSGAGAELGNAVRDNFDQAFGTDFLGEFGGAVRAEAENVARARIERQGALDGQVDGTTTDPITPGSNGGGGGSGKDFASILANLERENELLRVQGLEREILSEILNAEKQLKRDLTQVEAELVAEVVRQNAVLQAQSDILTDLRGPIEEAQIGFAALNDLLDQGKISAQEYGDALATLRVQATETNNTFLGGLANGLARVAEQANDFGKGVSDILVGAFDSASDAIVEFAKTGQFNLRAFFQDIFAQLLKLAANTLFSQLLRGFLGGGFGGGGFGLLGSLGLPGFATGGSFEVGGDGRTDSTLVAFNATRGERVSVETPQQQRRGGEGQAMQPVIVQQAPPTVNVTIGARQIVEALQGPEGDEFFVDGLERNRKSANAVLQGG